MEDARNIDFHFQFFILDENQMDENHTDRGYAMKLRY